MKKILYSLFLGFIILIILTGVGVYWYCFSHTEFVVRQSELVLPPGYEKLDGIKIVLVSDLHMTDAFNDLERFREIVRQINKEEVDFVFFTGDFIATRNVEWPMSPSRVITRMRTINAKYGIFVVTGNHDWYSDVGEVLCRELRQVGIYLLDNDCVTIPGICNLVGVQDEYGPQGVHADAAMLKIDPQLPTIALIHRPGYWEHFPAEVKLFFAGHTHGGQICLPVVRDILLMLNRQKQYSDHDYKLPQERQLHISYGIGTTWLRVRINCPPEIRVFVCRKGKS